MGGGLEGIDVGSEVKIRLWSEKRGSGGRTMTSEGGKSEERTGEGKRTKSREWPDV